MVADIRASGRSARSVAASLGLDPTTLHRYTSAKVAIPVSVTVRVCEEVGSSPQKLAVRAYERLVDELGPPE